MTPELLKLKRLGYKMRREVRRLDPKLHADDPAFLAAVVLLLSAELGPNVRRIASAADVPEADVWPFEVKLRRSGIWTRKKVDALPWLKPETGVIEFWLAVSVATGHVERAKGGRSHG